MAIKTSDLSYFSKLQIASIDELLIELHTAISEADDDKIALIEHASIGSRQQDDLQREYAELYPYQTYYRIMPRTN